MGRLQNPIEWLYNKAQWTANNETGKMQREEEEETKRKTEKRARFSSPKQSNQIMVCKTEFDVGPDPPPHPRMPQPLSPPIPPTDSLFPVAYNKSQHSFLFSFLPLSPPLSFLGWNGVGVVVVVVVVVVVWGVMNSDIPPTEADIEDGIW